MGVLSVDQVKVFLAIVEHGSFGKAAKVLHRHQSAISYAVTNLETQLGVALFERSDRKTRLTPAGDALLTEARKVTHSLDALRDRALSFARGIEPELVVVVDAFCPLQPLQGAFKDFADTFPMVKLQVRLELVAVAVGMLQHDQCTLGVISHPMSTGASMRQVPLDMTLELGAYAAPGHPLACLSGRLAASMLDEQLQLLLTDESGVNMGMKFSPRVWQSNDFRMLHMMLLSGAGWAFMPTAVVADDLAAGRLVTLELAAWPASGLAKMQMMAVYGADTTLGPAATWLLNRLAASPGDTPPPQAGETGLKPA